MVFSIKNLACKYPTGPVVLQVPELDIARGELIFIVGASGIGKSTFLEALGLMNRTIATNPGGDGDANITFYPQNSSPIALQQIWDRPKDELADLRSQYFSFIFQQTNLFPHFSVGENMMMSYLISGASKNEAEKKVREVMRELNLDDALFHKRVVEVSGGQRQRLAFVRAFTAPFDVLLADEPTGNLDPVTSRKLLTILKTHLKDNNKTGILVSHDIRLALEFADRIIPIVRAENTEIQHGLIDLNEILVPANQHWMYQKNQTIISDPVQLLWDHISRQI
jgi:ABC-type lipoprotein export system ATPase subunit